MSLLESSRALVGRVFATDADLSGSQNALLTYSLISVTPLRHRQAAGSANASAFALLHLEHGTGALTVGRQLSDVDAGEYAVRVSVSDRGHPARSTRFNFTLVLDGARFDPYAAQAGAAVVTATGSHSAYAGLCGEASGTGMEEAGVTGTTLALLVVTLIAVLFAITFLLLCLHYKHNLRAAAEAQAEAERKRSRQLLSE